MPKGKHKPLTAAEEQKILQEYLKKPVKRLATELGITYGRVMRILARHGLSIPQEIMEQRKKDSQKKIGDVPFNKGKKQIDYMLLENIEKSAKTRFKKGNVPYNIKPNGYISVRRDKTGKPYRYIRQNKGNWELYHRHLWQQENGPIPENHIIAFKDNNPLNCNIENLELITKEENMLRNSVHQYPKEVIPTLKILKKIKTKIIEHGKK